MSMTAFYYASPYDKLDHDDKGIEMFMASWSLSSEPSPRGMYSETNPMNDLLPRKTTSCLMKRFAKAYC